MSILFEPCAIGQLTLKNRFIKSSTAESMAGPDGEVTPAMLDFSVYNDIQDSNYLKLVR
jgi:2,4-dienoyl-CoA reductase-like NADH-dependent reductase (Old Yellow Enzyme family)